MSTDVSDSSSTQAGAVSKVGYFLDSPVSTAALCAAFLKERRAFLIMPLFLLFLQLLILYISGSVLENVVYSTGVTLSLYAVFFCTAFVRYYVRFRSFLKALRQAEIEDSYCTDTEELPEKAVFTLNQRAAWQLIQTLKHENTALKETARQRVTAREDYFALWLHQIKTPIASLQVLFQNRDTSADAFFHMQSALLTIENYTQMALQYLKLHGSERSLHITTFELDSVLQAIFKRYRVFFIYKKIELNYEPLNMTLIGDSVLCSVMIEQIISNSLKYCIRADRQGCITVKRALVSSTAPKEFCTAQAGIKALLIEDNGIGIAASDLPKIFDKGYSGLNGQRAEKATGLGLYLAREIAARLNAAIDITSEYGQWTRALIRFA
ncbi:MAG: sensor histidine kinase [Treponema sp.]